MGQRFVMLCASWLVLTVLPSPARTGETYYVVVFSHQGHPNFPRSTHTFATFVKATESGAERSLIETHTISWTPSTLTVRLARLRPEQGVNLDLETSLRWALAMEAQITCWGPFQIDKELYDRALRQIALLQSGAVKYKMVDTGYRPHHALNCIHAVSDIDTDKGLLDTGTARGEAAGALVASHFRRWMINPGRVQQWVYDRLGLTTYRVVLHDLEARSRRARAKPSDR